MPFIRAPIPDRDDNTYQGVLGLARGPGYRWSFVKYLQSQGVIRRAVVSFNFESLDDETQRSQVAFGVINYNEIDGQQAGTNTYSNLGREKWGLLIDDFLYDGRDMTNGQRAKVALIDSANSSIQLPEQVWANTVVVMQHQLIEQHDINVVKRITDKGMWEMRFLGKKCRDVRHFLKPIQFKIESTTVILHPEAYTFETYEDQDYCQIGLHAIPGETSEYRLGSMFLRSFYTALDFDKDEIHIGVNKDAARTGRAQLIGSTNKNDKNDRDKNKDSNDVDPNSPGSTGSSAGTIVAIVFIVIFTIITILIVLYVRNHHAKEQHVNKKTGLKETNNKSKKAKATAINQTNEDSGSEEELSSEENKSSEGSDNEDEEEGDKKESVVQKKDKEIHYLNQNPDLNIEQGADGDGSDDKEFFENGMEQPLIYKSSSQKRKEEIEPDQSKQSSTDETPKDNPKEDQDQQNRDKDDNKQYQNDDDYNEDSSPIASDDIDQNVAESSDIVDENEDDEDDEYQEKDNGKEDEDDEEFDIEGSNDESQSPGDKDANSAK